MRDALGIALFFVAVGLALVAAFPSTEMLGRYHEVDGRREIALGQYRQLARGQPHNKRIRLRIAHLYLSRGKAREAIDYYEQAIRLDPDNVELRRGIVSLYASVEDWPKAERYMRYLADHDPRNRRHWLELLVGYYRFHQQQARLLEYLERLVIHDPLGTKTEQRELVDTLLFFKRYKKARTLLEAATAVRPNDLDTQELLAHVYLQSAQPARAAAILEQLVAKKPASAMLRQMLVDALTRARRQHELVKLYVGWIARRPADIELRREYADFIGGIGRNKDAIAQYEQLLQKTPDDLAVRRTLADLYSGIDRPREALAHYEILAKARPDDRKLKLVLADHYAWIRQHQKAVVTYTWLLERKPTSLSIRRRLAETLVAAGRELDAIPHFEYLLRQGRPGRRYELHLRLANLYSWNKKDSQAVSHLDAMVASRPTDWDTLVRAADGYETVDLDKKALAVYRRLAGLRPSSLATWKKVAALAQGLGQLDVALGALDRIQRLLGRGASESPDNEKAFEKREVKDFGLPPTRARL